jgi:hypothetical protein
MDPFKIPQNKLSRENIIEAQAEELAEIIGNYQDKRAVNVYITKRPTLDTNTKRL